ncbi:MAG TPA: hypothetical protein PK557_02675 [Paludibacteraceae bacterium]|nr:hypothetical protein [Paludibacteraceae bacterium]
MKNTEVNKSAQTISDQFKNASGFLTQLSLFKDIERSINFYEGRQWNMDADISEYPKIVLNIIKQIAQVKHSGILGNNYAFLVDSDSPLSTRKIEAFLKRLHYQMKMKRKDRKILKDVFKKGTGILYFYWDKDTRSIMSKSGGRLKAEAIDIRNFRVADPSILEIQEQEWVAFATRERIEALEAQFPKVKGKLVADADLNTVGTQKEPYDEDVKKQFVTVYTKFFRNEDGEVCFIKATDTEILEKETFLNPTYNGKKKEEPNSTSLQDGKEIKNYPDVAFTLYPFASLVFDERDNCFYGIPAVLEYIETQKSVNKHFSVYDKGLDDAVLGGYVYRNGVLGEQEITADNGQTIGLDMQVGERWNDVFGKIPTNNIPSDALNYSINLLGVLRNVTGTTNVAIGQSDYSGQSGKQTQMLLERAKENATDLAQAFNDFKVDQVEIMFMFAKFYYDNEPFVEIEHGKDDNRIIGDYTGKNSFNGTEYQKDDVQFDLQVSPSQALSEATLTEILGLSVQSGQIDISDYIDLIPDGYFPNRVELKHKLQQGTLAIMKQMEAKLQQAEQVMQQMAQQYNKTMEEYTKKINTVDNIIRENQALKEMLANIESKKIEKNKEVAKKIIPPEK